MLFEMKAEDKMGNSERSNSFHIMDFIAEKNQKKLKHNQIDTEFDLLEKTFVFLVEFFGIFRLILDQSFDQLSIFVLKKSIGE